MGKGEGEDGEEEEEEKDEGEEGEGGGGGGWKGGLAARWGRVERAAAVEVTTYCCLRPRKALHSTLRMGQHPLGRSGAKRMNAVRLLGCARALDLRTVSRS